MAYNIAKGAGGALAGAGTGAGIGSIFGPIGTGLGALFGGGVGALTGLFSSKGNNQSGQPGQQPASSFLRNPGQNIQTGTPEQQQLQNQSLLQALQVLTGQGGLNPIGQQAVNRFNTETIPSLAERFTAMGAGAPHQSSAFQGALGRAGAQLNTDLAAQQYGILALLSGLGSGNTLYQPEQPGFAENSLASLLNISPLLLDAYLRNSGTASPAPATQISKANPVKGYSPPYNTPDYKAPLRQAGYQLGGAPLPPQAP